jgi:hypothetical protein
MHKLTQEQLKLLDEFYWGVESGRLCPPNGIWYKGQKDNILKKLRNIFDCGEYDEGDKFLLNRIRKDYIEDKK